MMHEFAKLKKIMSDRNKTVLRHPDGHELHISHNTINPQDAQKLMNHPAHFDDGGQVQSFDTKAPPVMSVDPSQAAVAVPVPVPVQAPNPAVEQYGQLKQKYINDQVSKAAMSKTGGEIYPDNPQLNSDADKFATNQLFLQKQQQDNAQADQQNQMLLKAQDTQALNAQKSALGLPTVELPKEVQDAMNQKIANPAQTTPGANIQQASMPQQQDQDFTGSTDYMNTLQKGIQGQQAGLFGEAQAMQKAGQQESGIANQYAGQMQQQMNSYQKKQDALEGERQNFINDVQQGHIDPDRYIKNMSTGSKLASGIGLILGGFAGGVLHQENPAMKFLQNNIDNDIRSQAADLGKKENLLSSNLKQFGNLRDATDMTRVMTGDVVSTRLKAIAAQNQGNVAGWRALQAASKLDADNAQVMSQLKARASLLGGVNQGSINPASNQMGGVNPSQNRISQLKPQTAIGLMIQDPKEKENAYKELSQAQEIDKLRNDTMGAFHSLDKKFLAGVLTPGDRSSFIQPYAGRLAKLAEGRFNLQESNQQMNSMMPSPGDSKNTRKDKLKALGNFMDSMKVHPTLDKWGINSGIPSIYDDQGQSMIQETPLRTNGR